MNKVLIIIIIKKIIIIIIIIIIIRRHIHATGITTTGGMADECLKYHSRLAEQLSAKKQESYATTRPKALTPKLIENPEKEELRC